MIRQGWSKIHAVDIKAHHEGWARKAAQEVLELERAVEVIFLS